MHVSSSRLAAVAALLIGCARTEAAPGDSPAPPQSGAATQASSAAAVTSVTLAPLVDTAAAVNATATPLAPLITSTPFASSATKTLTLGSAATVVTNTVTGTAGAGQLHACCNALRAKSQQPSAQAAQLAQAAALCDGLAAAVGNAGGGAQLEQLKPLLQGATLPPVCQGL